MVIIPLEKNDVVQYFQAVQQGRKRANRSQMKMFKVAGFGMLTLTTKKNGGNFEPVGEEEYVAVIESQDGHVAIIVDSDGFTKAQSKAMGKDEAVSVYEKLRQTGIPEYPGSEIRIWTETRRTVQNESG